MICNWNPLQTGFSRMINVVLGQNCQEGHEATGEGPVPRQSWSWGKYTVRF